MNNFLHRRKLYDRFEGISVHGLPMLSLEDGQSVDYDVLTTRFKESLGKIVSIIMDKSVEPKTVTVGTISMELNSTNAEVVIGTVIEEANKGNIDLSGFEAFWTYMTQSIEVSQYD